jgi:hypothetical protein
MSELIKLIAPLILIRIISRPAINSMQSVVETFAEVTEALGVHRQ